MLKRRIIMGLLALGTIGGFAAGFASMGCRAHSRREAWERHVADVCVGAAKRHEAEQEDGDSKRRDRDDSDGRRRERTHDDHD